VLGLECIRDVLEKDQTEDGVLVFRRVHVVSQCIGSLPELGFKTQIGASVFPGVGNLLSLGTDYSLEI
jgi:hypothetical protein